jgi:hypothetical protein
MPNDCPLEKEFTYFIEHQDELVKEHVGKVIAIKDERVIGVFATELEAVRALEAKYPLGTFLVQRCEPGPSCYSASFHGHHVAFSPC